MSMRQVLPYLMSVGLVLGVVGCGVRPAALGGDRPLENPGANLWNMSAVPQVNPTSTDPWSSELPQMAIAVVDQTIPKTTSAILYIPDGSCASFQPRTVSLPAQNTMNHAISQLMEEKTIETIPLAGYRVEQRLSGTVRVDLRFKPDMTQSVYALSNCEQFALFGSIRATLVQNPQWQVTQVIFTERGKELAL